MKNILKGVVELVPPKDFDYKKLEEETEMAKRRQEDRKIEDVDNALALLSNIYNKKIGEYFELRGIPNFKSKVDLTLRDSEVEIYVKAVINSAVEQKLQLEKKGGDPVVIRSTKGRQ